jgi:hypothetical protein
MKRLEKLNNEELHSLYSSPLIVRMIKSRRMGLSGHVPRTGTGKSEETTWRTLALMAGHIKMDLKEIGMEECELDSSGKR